MTALLIVEDKAFRTILSAYFKMAGWNVVEEASVAAGIAAALISHPRFIVCDAMRPDTRAVEMCATLRSEPGLERMKFIIYSGDRDPAAREAAFAGGVNVVIQKPVHMNDILALMHYLKSEYPDLTAEILQTPRVFFAKPPKAI